MDHYTTIVLWPDDIEAEAFVLPSGNVSCTVTSRSMPQTRVVLMGTKQELDAVTSHLAVAVYEAQPREAVA